MKLLKQETTLFNIAQFFLDFYKSYGYKVIPGSSLLDPSVPMTFVMSAGLAQVQTSAKLHGGRTENCYALIQNCFRYFDMEHIGKSPIHLSLFQMPGAFTFGPLSKSASIFQIWKLLTKGYGIPTERLWITYFSGDYIADSRFNSDQETYKAWLDVGILENHVVGLNAEHNFWKQSASIVGEAHVPKCGPHTEVFFDLGNHLKCNTYCAPGCNCGRFVEIMNTLFITLHIDDQTSTVRPLDEPFAETVIGLERLAMILQGVSSIFDIDAIHPLIRHIQKFVKTANLSLLDISAHERIIADHIRAIMFLTADDAPPPGKGGRARLMRKLIRETLTSQKLLEITDPAFVSSLVGVALDLYGPYQLKLLPTRGRVFDYVADESERFEHTLKAGYHQIDHILKNRDTMAIAGNEMIKLEKHYGIPFPLLKARFNREKINFSYQAYQMAYNQWRQEIIT